MSAIDTTRKDQDEDDDVGRTLEEIDDECNRLRRELERLRNDRLQLMTSRSKEIKQMEYEYRNAKEKLQRKLPEHANIATYRQCLRYYQRDDCKNQMNGAHRMSYTPPSSNYIIQQETPLMSAMHRSFCVFPHQVEICEREYEHEIYPYFRKEIQELHLDCQEMTEKWMSRLSDQAEENDTLYDSYRTEIEKIEMDVKRHRRILFQEKSGKTSVKKNEEGYDDDERSVLSETDHSSDSEDENSSRGKDGIGFLKEALHLFSVSPKKDTAAPSKIDSTSDSFHEHLCKGGAVFQIAANNFLLPFTSKGD